MKTKYNKCMVSQLRLYLENTPIEQLKKEWDELGEYGDAKASELVEHFMKPKQEQLSGEGVEV